MEHENDRTMGGGTVAGDANAAGALRLEVLDEGAPKGLQPTYDWQAAFQAFYGHGQRQASAPVSASLPSTLWAGQTGSGALFSGGLSGQYSGAFNPFSASPGPAFDANVSRVKAWLPGQLSRGESLQRAQGSLGSLGNLLKSNGESQSRSSGGSESTHEDDKSKVDTDLVPGLQILRKRSYEHMGLDAVAEGGTGMPPYRGKGAFASAFTQDFTSALSKPSAKVPLLQPMDRGLEKDMWFKMGQGTESGGNEGNGDLDDKEFRKQRRKQSNRESARRSRLRKQAECEELSGRVDHLTKENVALRTELVRLSDQCAMLASDNRALQEELIRVRSRGHAWRPAAAPLSAGTSQARSDRSPFSSALHPEGRSPDRVGYGGAGEHNLGQVLRQHSLRAEHDQQTGEGAGGRVTWPEPPRQRVPSPTSVAAGPSGETETGAASMAPTAGDVPPVEAVKDGPSVQVPETGSPVEAGPQQGLPDLDLPRECGTAAPLEEGREAQSVGDTGPSTPGPILNRDSHPAERAWLPEDKSGQGEKGGSPEAQIVCGKKVKSEEGELLFHASPTEGVQEPGAAKLPPVEP